MELGMRCLAFLDIAREVGLTDRVWSIEDIGSLLAAAKPTKRGPYKKKSE
jgi:hypothetical protein